MLQWFCLTLNLQNLNHRLVISPLTMHHLRGIHLISIKHYNHTEQRSDLPLISEFLKTGQTEQSWREVIGCWTIAGWLTDWLTGGLTERLFDSLEMKGKARTFFSPQGREVSGLTIPDDQAPKGTQELRWNVTTSCPCFLISFCFTRGRLLGSW